MKLSSLIGILLCIGSSQTFAEDKQPVTDTQIRQRLIQESVAT